MEKEEQDWITRIYTKLTAPKTIKFCGYMAMVVFFGLLGLAIIVAVTVGPYNIIDNWISDMGSFDHTPAPFLLDSALIGTGILLIPFIFYIESVLAPIPRTEEELPAPHRWSYRLVEINFFFSIIGSISMVCVGIFSEDRSFGLHFPFSVALFGSFAFGAIFLGIRITFLKQDLIPKPYNMIIGLYGLIVPFTVGAIAGFHIFENTGMAKLMEWIIFFVLLGVIVPIFFSALRHAEKHLKNENS